MVGSRLKVVTVAALLLLFLTGGVPVEAANLPEIRGAGTGTMLYTPSVPAYNPSNPGNLLYLAYNVEPLAYFNPLTLRYWPVLASNWTINAEKGTLTIYLRKGLQWYNGSATMPFTAWDVYAYLYIGNKVFGYFVPYVAQNSSGIKVLNNYTIQIQFAHYAADEVPYILESYISTPWAVWKPIVQDLQSMNVTEAMAQSSKIEDYMTPAWSLSPYYAVGISPPWLTTHLEPSSLLAAWASVFPYHTWQDFAPVAENSEAGGNTQAMNLLMAHQANFAGAGLSPSQNQVLESNGISVYMAPQFYLHVFLINQTHYPWNIPQVRQAIAYAINRTEVAAAWGLSNGEYTPADYGVDLNSNVLYSFPASITSEFVKYSYNPAKAASILESLGFYKKGGVWYTPNGTELTLSIQAPSGYTDSLTQLETIANELTAFGIPSSVAADSTSTYMGVIFPDGDYQAAGYGSTYVYSYQSAWMSYADPWTLYPTWNPTKVYDFVYPNGTKGDINLTEWTEALMSATPGTPVYNSLLRQYFAFYQYWLPAIPTVNKMEPWQYDPTVYNLSWVFKLPPTAQYSIDCPFIIESMSAWNCLPRFLDQMFGITPPGIQSPLAEAIANHSVVPAMAQFLGLNSTYSENYYASLAKAALSSSTISLSVSPTSTAAGTPVTLTAALTFPNGTPASGIGVTFASDGKAIGTSTTSSSGVATLSYTPTSAGTYSLSAYVTSVPSVTSTASLSVTSSVTVPVPVVYPSLTLSVSPTSTAAGTPVTLTATATFPNGTAASGYSVGFFANGAGIGTSTTSSSGVATLSYTPTSAGTYSLTADLTSHTSTASSPVTLTVTSPPVTPTPTPTTNYSLYYAIAAVVVIVVVVVAAVLALSRRGKKGPAQRK